MSAVDTAVCGGKAQFLTYSSAANILKNMKRRKDNGVLQVYRCPSCRMFHIGTQNKERKTTERRARKYGRKETVLSAL